MVGEIVIGLFASAVIYGGAWAILVILEAWVKVARQIRREGRR